MRLKHWFYTVPLRLRSLFRRRQVEEELDEELRYHIERQIEEHISKGMTEEEARYAALRAMGGVERRKEECRDMRRVSRLEDLMQDVRYSLRTLRKSPGFTAVAVITLALGIGANTAIFSVVNALMLRPLPFPDPERLVWVEVNSGTNTGGEVEGGLFLDWQEQSRTLEGIAAINSGKTRIDEDWGRAHARSLIGSGEAEIVEVGKITASFFTVLGVKPTLGRDFIEGEDRRGSDRVAILSYGLWQRRYNGDPEIIGKTITLDVGKTNPFGDDLIVVGVAPASFRYFHPFDVWVPMGG